MHTAKASVFTDLFGDTKYLVQLYRALHPERSGVTENSFTNVTIKNIFLNLPYNDLGFCVDGKYILMVEAQAIWSVNIVGRSLFYLVQTYQGLIDSTKQNVYKSRKLILPKPELYVIFTGERIKKPEFLYLSKEFFGGEECSVEVKVKMIYDGEKGDIINQYVTFTKIYDEQIKKFGRTREAVMTAIQICRDRNVLSEYLRNCEKEVVDILLTLYDEERVLKSFIESERWEATEKAEKKATAKTKKSALKMYQRGDSIEDIMDILDVPRETLNEWLKDVSA